jgi:hypothetical protein
MLARKRYVPGGMFIIKYSPLASEAAPNLVPSIRILVPINGSPVFASFTLPEIFPVVCAGFKLEKTNKRTNAEQNLEYSLNIIYSTNPL